MEQSQLAVGLHGLIALIWFAFGAVGLQTGQTTQAGIGFGAGAVLLVIGWFVASRHIDE